MDSNLKTKVLLADEQGHAIRLREVDGFYIPYFPVPEHAEEFKSIPTWKVRDDDIMLVAFPKCGTHWMWEMISMLASGDENYKHSKSDVMMEAITQEDFNEIPSPRILNNHLLPQHLPTDFFKRKQKIVLVARNPKDVSVSLYNHVFNLVRYYDYHGEFKDFVKMFMQGKVEYGNYFDYLDAWQKFMKDNPEYPILTVYYEDLISNGHNELEKVNEFVGYGRSKEFVHKVYDLCGFDNMKKGKEFTNNPISWRDGQPKMFRKGKVGDWKGWFTVTQNEVFDKLIADRLKTSNFSFKYSL